MFSSRKMQYVSLFYVLLMIMILSVIVVPSEVRAAPSPVDLGSASSFGILAGSTITNTGSTTLNGSAGGDIGLYPGDDPTILIFPGQVDVTLSGTVHLFDAAAQQAKADLLIAYNDAASRISDETISADLGGRTLTPGVYTSASSIGITGILTLDGGNDPNAVFIFQAGSTLTTASNSEIRLINDAQACNVFWQVGSSATLGTDSVFVGDLLVTESITETTRVRIDGQLLALNGAVTLDTNVIRNDACQSAGSLKVSKVVEGNTGDMTLPNFEITVTGPNNFIDTQTIASGSAYTWPALVSGTYTVTENALGQGWSISGTGEYVVEMGEMTEVTITNTYTTDVASSFGKLTVTKIVVGDIGGLTLPNFTITLSGPGGFVSSKGFTDGESYTWEDLVPGEYTIAESRTGLSSKWAVSGEGSVTVVSNVTVSKTVTNTYTKSGGNGDTPLPNTGDSTQWITFGALTLLVIGSFVLRKTNQK